MIPEGLSASLEKRYHRRKLTNRIFCFLLGACAVVALCPLMSVFSYVLIKGLPGLNLSFFTQLPKPVGEIGGGMANALLGTLVLILLASAIGVPWGVATGLYLSEYGRGRISHWVRFSADLLSSVPSIIVGLFVYSWVVVSMKRFSAIAGGIALGILMIPTVARSVEELLKMVPVHIREAGLALGLPRWKVILRIVLKGSSKAITTGIMLAVARVAGETAPLLFTSFSNQFWQSRLDQPTASLPMQVYTYAISPYQDWHNKAWTGALVLVLLIFLLNVFTRLLLNSNGRTRS